LCHSYEGYDRAKKGVAELEECGRTKKGRAGLRYGTQLRSLCRTKKCVAELRRV
jgi:hypothetical protein